jgi:hypothetical protein
VPRGVLSEDCEEEGEVEYDFRLRIEDVCSEVRHEVDLIDEFEGRGLERINELRFRA